jgi:uncharacterized protein DUF3352
MPDSVKVRFVQSTLLAALLALLAAGCGGGGGGGGEADLASVAPPGSPLYGEFTVQPEGEAKENIEALAQSLAGVDDLGGLIESELEKSAADEGEEIDVESEVKPWLGDKGAFAFPEYKEGNFEEGVLAIQVTDAGAAEDFIDKHATSHGEPDEDGSYEGVAFKVEKDDGQTVGVVDEMLVVADSEALFKQVVDASNGESLADEETFSSAISAAPSNSSADVYVDIGGLIEQSGGAVDPEAKVFLDSVGIEPEEATAVASVIPGSSQIEIDLSTDLGGENPPSGDASKLLESLPADSLAAFVSPEFGKRFQEGIDRIDENGIPGQVPPHQLKKALEQSGIDLEAIAGSVGDLGLFVEGSSQRNLEGALVLETEDPKQAANTVSNLGLFLRSTGTPGITAISGEASGFSIRSAELGSQPVVVVAKGNRIAIGYGLSSAKTVLGEGGETLGDDPAYKEAVSALGGTPISGFVDGPAALKLASAIVPPYEEGFREAKPYLTKIDYLALGSEASDGLATAKLIVGIGK